VAARPASSPAPEREALSSPEAFVAGEATTNEQETGPARPPAPTSTRRTVYRSRAERRMARRAKRRRKMVTRLGLALGSTMVVVAAAVALFTLLGGPDPPREVVTTLPAGGSGDPAVGDSALLVIEQGESVPLLVLLSPRQEGGTVLALSGLTLLKTEDGFKTLAELHLADRDEALGEALSRALGVSIDDVASVEWSAAYTVMQSAGLPELPPSTLVSLEGESEQVAQAVLALVAKEPSAEGKEAWSGLPLEGDAGQFRKTVSELAPTVAAGGWTTAVLTGKLVEGRGFTYIEPDIEAAKAVLAGASSQVQVVLQVENGSGVLGVAQETSQLLASLGYTMLPVGNSEDFPDVARTRIEAAPDAVAQAAKVRALLGVGTVEVDSTLDPGHIVVVIGKDYIPPQTTVSATAG